MAWGVWAVTDSKSIRPLSVQKTQALSCTPTSTRLLLHCRSHYFGASSLARVVISLDSLLHLSLQNFTSSQHRSHFFPAGMRQARDRPAAKS